MVGRVDATLALGEYASISSGLIILATGFRGRFHSIHPRGEWVSPSPKKLRMVGLEVSSEDIASETKIDTQSVSRFV